MEISGRAHFSPTNAVTRCYGTDPCFGLLKLRVYDDPNPLRERGIEPLRLTQCEGKSLADASGCDYLPCFLDVDLPLS
jgi:hypothetical protein